MLEQVDSNGDIVKSWCRRGLKSFEAKCVLCDLVISCAQHGTSAVTRHASSKMHLLARKQHCDADGKLKPLKSVQPTISFSNAAEVTTLNDSVVRAEALFAISLAVKGIPFSYADTATKILPQMFPDSQIAGKVSCGRTKASYMISDGLGPYFKKKVVEELSRPDVYYSIQIDETPKPEQRVQQLDVLVRYFSRKQQRVVIEHLESFNLGRATADIIVDCIERSITELPKEKLLCFFSDGPNTMKSVKKKLKESVHINILDIGECNLHKVHNSFGTGLTAFGADVELLVMDVYYFFKHAVRSSQFSSQQKDLGIPEHIFLRHVNNRWLTFQCSLERVLEQYDALKAYFHRAADTRPTSSALHRRLAAALADKQLLAKMLFLRNIAELFTGFQALFQRQELLIHIVLSESLSLLKKLLGRFMRHEVFKNMSAAELKCLDVAAPEGLKQAPEIGFDTEQEIQSWSPEEKKSFKVRARAFYIATARHLLKQLPLDNKLLFHLRFLDPALPLVVEETVKSIKYVAASVPHMIKSEQVASLVDEWHCLHCKSPDEGAASSNCSVDTYWASVLAANEYPLLSVFIRALLSLPHGNADCERGFSENKRIIDNRANLGIVTLNGIRHVKSYLKRYDSDASQVPVTRELINAVKHSHKKYLDRLQLEAEDEERRKRKASADNSSVADKKAKLQEEKQCLEGRLESSRAMLQRAQGLIKGGLANKNMEDIECGQVLLAEANDSLTENMTRLADINQKLQQL